MNKQEITLKNEGAVASLAQSLSGLGPIGDAVLNSLFSSNGNVEIAKSMDAGVQAANTIAKALRKDYGWLKYRGRTDEILSKSDVAKSMLDVGTLTNLANVTGGQTLGYISLDTALARSTVRPSQFTAYLMLTKTPANQVVDYWPAVTDIGGAAPGAAGLSYTSAQSTQNVNAGSYNLNNITLKLLADFRAVTTALAAQNSFVDVGFQETTNAALAVLSSVDYEIYYGNPTLYPNQFEGLIQSTPSENVFDFQEFLLGAPTSEGWSNSLSLFNAIYEVTGQLVGYNNFARTTHAFMAPSAIASLQGLTQQQLNNILNEFSPRQADAPIWVNGQLAGMRTRFGDIQFPLDLFITSRDTPMQAVGKGTASAPTPPVSAVPALTGAAVAGSRFTGSYAAVTYVYAVASTDANMNESNLTFSAATVAVTSGYGVNLTITPPSDTSAVNFRVYRSPVNATVAQAQGNPVGSGVRLIGEIAANGASPVVFQDLNTKLPGSTSIFLLDLDEEDRAVDYRYLLPLSRINLFANSLYQPWAVATIGAVRNRIPKWNAVITNYVPDNIAFDPLVPNAQ